MYSSMSLDDTSMTLRYADEVHKNAQGDPVLWKLILQNDNSFVWYRLDWPADKVSAAIIRCAE